MWSGWLCRGTGQEGQDCARPACFGTLSQEPAPEAMAYQAVVLCVCQAGWEYLC